MNWLQLGQMWAMEPQALRAMVATLSGPQPVAQVQAAAHKPIELNIHNRVAHIPIAGPMMKKVPWIFIFYGIGGASTVEIREMVARAVESQDIDEILLVIDSPGGTVEGTQDLADDVAAANELKPVRTRVVDTMASAATWVGSQAREIIAGPASRVGSIGTFTVIDDMSEMAKKLGIETHVISSHELKGIGVRGAPLTDNQIADVQRNIDTYTDLFVKAVARGRGVPVSNIRNIATGQLWIGEEAKDVGLVDRIETSAPTSGASQEVVDMDEAAKLRLELADAKAKLEAQAVATKAAEDRAEAALKSQVEQIIKSNPNRVLPPMVEDVRAFGASCGSDLAKFQSFVEGLPEQTNASPTSQDLPPQPDADGGGAVTVSDEEKTVCRKLEISEKNFSRFSQVRSFLSNGQMVLEDGRTVTREELLA